MIKNNKWRHGDRHFVFPSLTPEMCKPGCSLWKLEFDNAIGDEVFALFREEPPYAATFAEAGPLTLIAHSGLVRSPHGIVAFIVWQIAVASPQETFVEQYLNPYEMGAIRLLSDAASQSHFKLVVLDCESGEVCAFIDYENSFGFDELASGMLLAIGNEPEGHFSQAVRHVMSTMSIPDLLATGQAT